MFKIYIILTKQENNLIYYNIINQKQKKKYFNLIDQGWEDFSEHQTRDKAMEYIQEYYTEYININKVCNHCKQAEGTLATVKYYDESVTTKTGNFKVKYIPKIYICDQCANECIEVKYL